jgi:hypothetical protein
MDNFLPNYLKFGLLGYGAATDTHTTIGWSNNDPERPRYMVRQTTRRNVAPTDAKRLFVELQVYPIWNNVPRSLHKTELSGTS